MNIPAGLDHCLSFINSQTQPSDRPTSFAEPPAKHAVTISRESGCGAHAFAERLVQFLRPHTPPDAPPWTIFDRNLVEEVLRDHQMPERLAQYMPEDRVLELDDIMDELFGLHPSSCTLVEKTSETILRLVECGNVIIAGRGANIITAKLPHVVHLRMVAPLKCRVENMQRFEHLPMEKAIERIHHEDIGRHRYVKKHFNRDINDPLLYHTIINMELVSLCEAVQMVGNLVLSRKLVLS
jgi:cytidylate kinase